jgi:hypothetical protein
MSEQGPYEPYRHRTCPSCGAPTHYHSNYDSVCCLSCKTWISPICDDADCTFCIKRPEAPPPDGKGK